jgi:hypothetical protein
MIKLILLTLFVTVSLSQTLHAKIFKWTDSEGKVHYSATPPKDTKEKAENIEDKIKFNIGKTQSSKSQATSESNTKNNDNENSNKKASKESYSEETSKARVAYCNGLRRNIHTLESSKNVNLAEEGKLKPLNTKEIGERLAKEKSNLEKNCAGL